MTAAILTFPLARGNVVTLEPVRAMRQLAALRPRDEDYMPATLALVLLQGWFEEVGYYRQRAWRELADSALLRIERMAFNATMSPGIRRALEIIRDAFAAKLREA